MNVLNENQCKNLDNILSAFGDGIYLDGELVLNVVPNEKSAIGLISILKSRGLITTQDVEDKDLPYIMILDSSAYIFLENGGFQGELKRENEKQKMTSRPHINIHSTGNQNVINTGDYNTIHASFNNGKGDLDLFKQALREHEVNEAEITEIVDIVQTEVPVENSIGPSAKNWMRKMLDKSMEGTWNIGLATAGGILTEILKKYYGL